MTTAPEDLPHLIRRFPRALWRPRAEQHAPHPESKGTRDACSAACAGVKNGSSGSAKTSSGKVTVQGPKSWPAQPSATAESSGGENSLSSLVSIPPPPSHTKFSHLTPPAAAVRGLGGGGGVPQEVRPGPTDTPAAENKLACHTAPHHTLAASCDHTLL